MNEYEVENPRSFDRSAGTFNTTLDQPGLGKCLSIDSNYYIIYTNSNNNNNNNNNHIILGLCLRKLFKIADKHFSYLLNIIRQFIGPSLDIIHCFGVAIIEVS